MAQLAIKGHETRGKEVIEILEMLGGRNIYKLDGKKDLWYILSGSTIEHSTYCFQERCYTLEEFLEKYPYKVGDKVEYDHWPCVIQEMCWDNEYKEIRYTVKGIDFCEYCSASDLKPHKEETMEEKKINQMSLANCDLDEVEIILGDKFELKIKEGKYYAVKKQLKYPKTYEECCDVLKIPNDERYIDIDVPLGYNKLLSTFTKLLICRNAYWKIAGKEMGMDKPWEPDWNKSSHLKDVIICRSNNIIKYAYATLNTILAFPTEEMRDVFYENFKDLIEQCKELL